MNQDQISLSKEFENPKKNKNENHDTVIIFNDLELFWN